MKTFDEINNLFPLRIVVCITIEFGNPKSAEKLCKFIHRPNMYSKKDA